MKEARSAIIIILILLFIIVGVGVAISRISNNEKAAGVTKTTEERGFLERIFLSSDSEDDGTPSTVTSDTQEDTNDGKMIIVNESSDLTTFSYNNDTADTTPVTTTSDKGGAVMTDMTDVPATIPSTGSPTAVVFTSLAGLASGVYLRKRN